ncbi:hypothetical protein CEXT_630751 [Caerostris extrusa]|uniref:Secreted protein n=1 Tax=Caerostris extrusa TaxID=172846 RepID=A0AAV4R2F2_CAEEX|nr:hypothetical protein CEXT_630751 [Caerostris extrusa]
MKKIRRIIVFDFIDLLIFHRQISPIAPPSRRPKINSGHCTICRTDRPSAGGSSQKEHEEQRFGLERLAWKRARDTGH